MSKLYMVTLGIDRAARDTKRRMKVKVEAGDRLSAAIAAEEIGDTLVCDPDVEYTHAVDVRELPRMMPLMLAGVVAA